MQMPGMDGEELGRLVTSEKRFTGTKLVMMTSLGQRGDARRLKEAGFSAYLLKPVRQSELFDCLIAVLGKKESPERHQPLVTRHSLRELRRTNVRILLAEDNITNQQVALGILHKLGFRADVAANGRKALEALQSIYYDLVLMDVQMPEMDGLETTRAVRAEGSGALNRAVPIIAMTAHAMQGDRKICLDAGMDDYIAKPMTPETLSELLEKWLARLDPAARTDKALPTTAPSRSPDPGLRADAEAGVFDETILLERMMGDRRLARVIAGAFLEDVPKQIEALRGYLDAGDAKGAHRQAHTIKGSAATVGGEALTKLAFGLEQAGKAGDLETVKTAFGELQDQFELLKKAMEASTLLDATKE